MGNRLKEIECLCWGDPAPDRNTHLLTPALRLYVSHLWHCVWQLFLFLLMCVDPHLQKQLKLWAVSLQKSLANLDLFFQRFAGSVTLNCKIQLAGTINSGSSRKLSVAVYKMKMMKWFTLGMQPVLLLTHLHTVDALPVDQSRWTRCSVLLSFP